MALIEAYRGLEVKWPFDEAVVKLTLACTIVRM